MLQLEVLILKLVAINGLSTSAIVVGEITTLAHELGNDTVESGALVAETAFASAQSTEVFSSARHNIGTELHGNKIIIKLVRNALSGNNYSIAIQVN